MLLKLGTLLHETLGMELDVSDGMLLMLGTSLGETLGMERDPSNSQGRPKPNTRTRPALLRT